MLERERKKEPLFPFSCCGGGNCSRFVREPAGGFGLVFLFQHPKPSHLFVRVALFIYTVRKIHFNG